MLLATICTLGGVLFYGVYMSTKEFKSIDEQVQLLRSRGLKINDLERAKEFLYRNNYYRISGYSLTLRKHDVFSKTATFDNIIDIYEFDHELRHILLKYIEIIEVTVKSIYAYEFSKRYGPTEYLNNAHFTNSKKHQEIIQKAEEQKRARLPHEPYLKHFVEDLHEDVPLWAYVDLLTISDISFMYSISEQQLKLDIAKNIGILNRGDELLAKFMHSITIIRNLCAHGSRLYNRLFEQKPSLNKQEKKWLITQSNGEVDNSHLFGFIIIMKRLLEPASFIALKTEISLLTDKYPFVNLQYYGFRNDWLKTL